MPPGKKPIRRRSTLDTDFAMDKQPPPAPGENFNVVIIGAGGINFGSVEGGPWNHSFRLEHKVAPPHPSPSPLPLYFARRLMDSLVPD
jgi:hypothetical protein